MSALASAVFAGHGLAARRGDRRLFAGLSFALDRGAALIVRGPNGIGKSTLLRLMAGFGRVAAGRFTWDSRDIADNIDWHRARVQYVGHQDALKPALTVLETLQFWCDLVGDDDRDAKSALSELGIAQSAHLPCRFLSAGQRRRLCLARLLVSSAPLWLLDEPVVGLDQEAIEIVTAMVERHRQSGGMVVLSTHQEIGLAQPQTLMLADFPPPAISRAALDLVW